VTFKQFIVIPLYIALLAFTMQAIDQTAAGWLAPIGNVGFGWIAFQAWAMYFMAGGKVEGGIKVFINYAAGIIASILIFEFGAAFSAFAGYWAFPLAVFLIVIPVICLERIKWTSFVPAAFVGAGAFFGFMSYVPNATYTNAAIAILAYCAFGLLYGYITVTIRVKYEASLKKG
jgi:hypothetical protein